MRAPAVVQALAWKPANVAWTSASVALRADGVQEISRASTHASRIRAYRAAAKEFPPALPQRSAAKLALELPYTGKTNESIYS